MAKFGEMSSNPAFAPFIQQKNLIRQFAELLDLTDRDLVKSDEQIAAEQEQAAQEQKAQREFSMQITELARQGGVSPEDLLNAINDLRNKVGQTGVM